MLALQHLLAVLMYGALMPRRVARHTSSASATVVWLAQLAGILIGMAVVGAAFSFTNVAGQGRFDPTVVMHGPADITFFVVVGFVAGIAGAYIVALVFLAFAHRDEPLIESWRHAYRTVRLFSPAWIPLVGLYLAPLVYLQSWFNPSMGFMACALTLWCALPVWSASILIRALGVDRPVSAGQAEPLCEKCGYVLLHLPVGGRCPECGEPTVNSLDPARRWYPGRAGSRRGVTDTVFEAASANAWLRPREFFGHLCLLGGSGPALRRVVGHFLATAGVGYLVMVVGIGITEGQNGLPAEALLITAILIMDLMVGIFCFWCLGTSLVGVFASRLYHRNLLHAAFLVAAYTSGFFVLWALVCTLSFWTTALLVARVVRNPFWPLLALGMINLGMAALYVRGVWQRMRHVRFGNWNLGPATAAEQRPT